MGSTPLSADEVHEVRSQLEILGVGGGPGLDSTWLQEKVETIIGASTFVYVAEGRANAVFRMVSADDGGAGRDDPQVWKDHPLAGYLLRIPKVVEGTAPHSYEELQRYREAIVEPRVGAQHLVPQLLVRLEAHHTDLLNAERSAHGQRDPGSSVSADVAFLIEDLSPLPWRDDLGLEFKPKWLAQSPIAPEGATRCRTCAREAFRNHEKLEEGRKKAVSPPVCPLGLVHADPAVVARTIQSLAPPDWTDADRERLLVAFKETGILERLRELQCSGDLANAMFDAPQDEDFGLAMTLRDCTCFVRMPRVPEDGGRGVEIRLADVDRKNWESKAEYWQHSHTNLVDTGYYHGREEPPMETHCLLSPDADAE